MISLQIGDLGASILGQFLNVNTTLQVLDLQSNEIGDSGVVALAEALKNNRTLKIVRTRKIAKHSHNFSWDWQGLVLQRCLIQIPIM